VSAADAPRLAADSDLGPVGQLLHDFNREFGEPTPLPDVLAARLRELTRSDDTVVLVAGSGPDAVAVLRLREAIWTTSLEAYLAELYVIPTRRGMGIGRALMVAVMNEAKRRGASTMDIGVDEPDAAARALYESLGFTNRSRVDGPLMYVYEREL
jgi:ribosomal protein S18 acetylase RimI-like enzyme